MAIVIDGSIKDAANAKKVRSLVKQISDGFEIEPTKSAFSLGVVNFGISLHLPIDQSFSNLEFQFFVDQVDFSHVPRVIVDYDQLFQSSNNKRSAYDNVLVTIEQYGTPHAKTFSNLISTLEKNTKVFLLTTLSYSLGFDVRG